MQQQSQQPDGRTQNESELVALVGSEFNLRPADVIPGSGQTHKERAHRYRDHRRPDNPPIHQRVQIIVMHAVGLQLHRFGPVGAEPMIEVCRSHAKPDVIPPHPRRRAPQFVTRVRFHVLSGSHGVFETVLEKSRRRNEEHATPNQDEQHHQGRQPVISMKRQHAKQRGQGDARRQPTAARHRHTDPGHNRQSRVTEKNLRHRFGPPHQRVGQCQRQ